MKRTLIIGMVVVAAVFGLVAYATAVDVSDTVTVNARMNPKIIMSIANPTVEFLDVDPGASYLGTVKPVITVKSNNDSWTFAADGAKSSATPVFLNYIDDAVDSETGTVGDRGVYTRTYEYTLDLTDEQVYSDLEAGVDYSAEFQYTVTY